MKLSKRLQAIADCVQPGGRAADIGTDHGYIPIWLLENGVCEHVYASDIREGPLKKAMGNARRYNVYDKISFLLSTGLSGYEPDSVDTVMIAGMGGETIIEILAAAPWVREKRLILQPQTKLCQLRAWLNENQYDILDAALVEDTGRIYTVWQLGPGTKRALSAVEYYVDTHIARDRLLLRYVNERIKKLGVQIGGMERSANADENELRFLHEAYTELIHMRGELEHD